MACKTRLAGSLCFFNPLRHRAMPSSLPRLRWNRLHFLLAVLLLALEVAIATVFSGWGWVRGSLGDVLVVLLIYHAVQAFADLRPLPVALAAVLLAYAVEGLQYLHAADWLGLPRGSVWRVVLGTHFSWGDMAMYTLGGLLAYALDRWLIQPRQPRTQAARTPSS